MRGTLTGFPSPHPLQERLPGVYADSDGDGFVHRFTSALDDLLTPVLVTLDNLPAYLDPFVAPEDVLDWLAGWVGVAGDTGWPVEHRRRLVAEAAAIHRRRGTPAGVADHVRCLTGGRVEVTDGGGVSWSRTPGSRPPGSDGAEVHVVVHVADPATVDRTRLDALVARLVPAHLAVSVDVLPERRPAGAATDPPPADADPDRAGRPRDR
ncbi:phage tail protein [Actinomycetospora termitidis]|uniref:Phage tail protein n=1 Tax=Actinomycetospora termitidis TaxID=3053470 RepID=A0ABT7M7A8_9PSEU|nr:phage tail protein [Actinomycetospora sp. Odt1-22]MDL5156563.1 phage tail protein [Actinomycetospora sp. Odt1-22]